MLKDEMIQNPTVEVAHTKYMCAIFTHFQCAITIHIAHLNVLLCGVDKWHTYNSTLRM